MSVIETYFIVLLLGKDTYGKPESYEIKNRLRVPEKKISGSGSEHQKGLFTKIRIQDTTETVRLDSNPGSAPGLASTLS